MQNTRIIILIPFYNAREYIRECVDSILMQSYTNWLAICADDHSEDGTANLIPDDPRIINQCNSQRMTALPNIYNAIVNSGIDYRDDDILCILDGDDKFLHPYALSIVGELYSTYPACLLTYGQYMTSRGRLGHCKPYSEREFESLREGNYWASHLKTFKWKLYREFLRQDPNLDSYKGKDGNFFTMTYDAAIMYPLLELAGYENVKFNKHPIYWYRVYDANDAALDFQKQKNIELEIRQKNKFVPAFSSGKTLTLSKRVKYFLINARGRSLKEKREAPPERKISDAL